MTVPMLFIREVRRPTGGNIKVRDYFGHAAAHPGIDARIWFPSGSDHASNDIWAGLMPERIAAPPDAPPDLNAFRFVCVNGKDWSLLPDLPAATEMIHFVQHPGYLADPLLRAYLERPARRICTTQALADQIAPVANGPIHVVPIGMDPAFLALRRPRKRHRITILGAKQHDFAALLAERLRTLGHAPLLLDGAWRPHADQAAIILATDILVALPIRAEGFYLPAIEGMAAGCVVICSDVTGNRGHCIAGRTCLQPEFGDLDAHVEAVRRALTDQPLRSRLLQGGRAMAARHSKAAERRAFHAVLDTALGSSRDQRDDVSEKAVLGAGAEGKTRAERAGS
ncbi:glycosyltransferase family 4 protein [Sphingomonas sp. ERG5]|uniref:glycosyltransferase family 4 protein n=1 Tax=Sphingomonas sp. ERG5 TaxID=1381597 RepID=UPI00054B88FD|nr:glycosyltransferase family 4 protein [Sphingomonas sp. ERG5]